ncbi:MAG: hypothetical protein WBV79_03375 [Rhodomicrobium sp.]
MSKNQLDADTLINGTSIAAKIIQEHPDLDEDAIDAALMAAYAKGASVEEWEAQTRKLLGLEGEEA